MHDADAMQAQPTHHTSMFSEVVMATPFPNNFKMLNMPPYNGRGDPTTHVEVFRSWMDFKRASDQVRC